MEIETIVWDVEWEIYICGVVKPKHGRRRFRTFEGAIKTARRIVSEINIAPSLHLQNIRKGEHSIYRNAMADFIEKLISNTAIFETKSDIPSFLPEDYPPNVDKTLIPLPDDAVNKTYYDAIDNKENSFTIKKIQNDKKILFIYPYGPEYCIKTDLLFLDQGFSYKYDSFKFEFYCNKKDALMQNDLVSMELTLQKRVESSKAKYSALILETLRQSDVPLSYNEIISRTRIWDRKAIWRNVKKLQEAGFDIRQDDKHRYYLPKTEEILSYKDRQIIKDSIALNPNITFEEKERLMELLSKI